MGWNQGWTIAEKQIVGLYDLGVLTLPVLDVICNAVGNSDIDSGGSNDLTAQDGKMMEEICMALVMPDFPELDHTGDEWDEDWFDAFSDMAAERWGWR